MTTPFQQLVVQIPPPVRRVAISPEPIIEAIESKYGLKIPSDLVEFAITYGTGQFVGEITTNLTIYNPLTASYNKIIDEELQWLREARESWEERDIPFQPYPAPDGLFPLGCDDCGTTLWWRISTSTVSIVVRWEAGSEGYREVSLALGEFFLQLLTRQITFPCWSEPWFMDSVRFEPEEVA